MYVSNDLHRLARLIRQVDDITRLYVNVHRYLRVRLGLDACQTEYEGRSVVPNVLTVRIQQLELHCGRSSGADRERATRLLPQILSNVRFRQFARKVLPAEVCLCCGICDGLDVTVHEGITGCLDPAGNAPRFVR